MPERINNTTPEQARDFLQQQVNEWRRGWFVGDQPQIPHAAHAVGCLTTAIKCLDAAIKKQRKKKHDPIQKH